MGNKREHIADCRLMIDDPGNQKSEIRNQKSENGSQPAPPVLMQIAPELLVPTPDNPRGEIDQKSESFKELVASIWGEGVRVPLQAQPMDRAGEYEVLDGARRLLAARAAGLRTIPVLVYEQLSEAEAFKIVLAANFAREDLTPLQQGRAVEILLQKRQGDLRAVAADLGQSESWVALRARLGKLSAKWRKAIGKGEFSDYGVGHLELIARLPEAAQESMMARDRWGYGPLVPRDDFTVDRLDKFINEKFVRALAKAPWALEDHELGPHGMPCSECQKRSSQEAMLFSAETDPAASVGADRCLDASCYRAKELAWLLRRKAEVEKERGEKIEATVTENDGHRGDEWETAKKAFGGEMVRKAYDDKVSAKEVKGGKAIFAVDGPHAGNVVWIVKHRPARTDASGRSTSSKAYLDMKRKEQADERKRYAGDFASAACAVEVARWIEARDARTSPAQKYLNKRDGIIGVTDLCDLCVAYRLAESKPVSGPAWDWLRLQLGVVVAKKKSYGTFEEELLPHEMMAAGRPASSEIAARAMALWLCDRDQADSEPVFAEEKRSKGRKVEKSKGGAAGAGNQKSEIRNLKSKLPANPMRMVTVSGPAAEKFVIEQYFLSKHSSASIQVIARELGVKCKSTRAGTVKAILDAKSPAGTMTKDLAAAFGVKYVEPEREKSKSPKAEKSKGQKGGKGRTRRARRSMGARERVAETAEKKTTKSTKKHGGAGAREEEE